MEKAFEDIIKDLEIRASLIRVGTNANDTIHIRDRREERHRDKRNRETEVGVRLPQAKEHLELPEATRRRKESFIP